jgi:hypothetical protein
MEALEEHFLRALDNFSTEEYVTSSVLGQSPSLTLVIGANIFKQILNTFKVHVIRYILSHLESYSCIISWIKRIKKNVIVLVLLH